ncbi:GntR-family transcriptional regulator [Companilactobacillus tucceti DSM 20183]|uniref:GntR-family transcriptional regulator n=1 Tax=Companilactobacillus tucceti DSM 20183 TaxID=1423811 RepID=A0A0R1J911_9LACO|nr:GntR family transcriptional regulator [Companilactobacillus tucceti]KRK64676.1 GntR-family transcriptional regulator [Companilactobacillus tucceti DSM 20183]
MPKKLYTEIYEALKKEIETNVYPPKTSLPREEDLSKRFDVTRNTVRRALKQLQEEGLVYAVKGRGVVVLEPVRSNQVVFSANNSEGFQGLRSFPQNKFIQELDTDVLNFKEIIVDEKIANLTSFNINDKAFYLERLRLFDGKGLAIDHSYFRSDALKGFSREDAQGSVYKYIRDNELFKVAAQRSISSVVSANQRDSEVLELGDLNCVGSLTKFVYTDIGSLFEYTETRYVPNNFAMLGFQYY